MTSSEVFGKTGEVDVGASSILLGDELAAQGAVEQLAAKVSGRGDVARAAAEVADECRRDLGEYAPARRLYEKLLARYPKSKQAMRAQRGIVNIDIKTGNYEAAEAGIKTLLAKYPNHDGLPQAFCWLGNDYLDARQDEKAAQCYQYVIDNRPDSNAAMSSWAGVTRVHIRRGDDQAVQTVIDKMIVDYNDLPELATAVFQVGEEYYYMAFEDPNKCQTVKSEEDLNKAKDIWEKIIAQCPQSGSVGLQHANYFSATCYFRLGEYDKAVGYYEKVVDNWPDYQYAWSAQYLIGSCYEKLRNSGSIPQSEAGPAIEQSFKAVVEKYPDSPLTANASLNLSDLNSKRGDLLEAARYLELFLVNAHPRDPRIESAKARFEELVVELEGESQ